MQNNFDVLILGGGLVGLTVAHLCANKRFNVAVIEQKTPDLTYSLDQYDLRCSAISRKSQRIFEEIGIWNTIVTERVSPYRSMVVWEALGFSEIKFNAAEVGEPDLGLIIENRTMIRALWEAAKQHSNITLQPATQPKILQMNNNEVLLETEEQKLFQANLIIGADGAQSWLRKTANIDVNVRDYHQYALVANVKTEFSHQETAWQRFLSEGPLAFLPLSEPCMSSIVWTATEEKINALMSLPEDEFCQTLAQAFDYRLGRILASSTGQCFPLKMLHAKQYIKERLALIGDALHVIHPLAGQGVNLGLEDAFELAEIINTARNNGSDIGDYLVLRKYERARKGAVAKMIFAMEFFKKTFTSQSFLNSSLRSFGIGILNKSSYLKEKIIQEALGL